MSFEGEDGVVCLSGLVGCVAGAYMRIRPAERKAARYLASTAETSTPMTSRKLIEKKAISLATTLDLDLARVERETLGRLDHHPSVSTRRVGRLLQHDRSCVSRRRHGVHDRVGPRLRPSPAL